MIKALIFDMDGTLIGYNQENKGIFPESAGKAIETLRKKGYKIIAATGRTKQEMSELDFLKDLRFDAIAAMSGQYCYTQEKEIHISSIPSEALQGFVDFQKIQSVPAIISEADCMYCNLHTEEFKRAMALYDTVLSPLSNISDLASRKVIQITPLIDDDTANRLLPLMPGTKFTRWSPYFVDFINKDGGKVAGLKKIFEELHLQHEECMAFGDGQNDIDMLGFVRYGIAMCDGAEELKEVADYVTESALNNGIANAIQHYTEQGVLA